MRSSNKFNILSTGLAVVVLAVLGGCCNYSVQPQMLAAVDVPQGEDSCDFLDRASEMEVVDMGTALHGLCLVIDGQDNHNDFQSRVDKLKSDGIVAQSWQPAEAAVLTKGQLAYMVYQACGVKQKGVLISIFGPTQRYCLRELQYQGMMGEGNEAMRVTGMELVAVLTRADIYKRTGKFPDEVGKVE